MAENVTKDWKNHKAHEFTDSRYHWLTCTWTRFFGLEQHSNWPLAVFKIILNQEVIPITCTVHEGQHNVQIYRARVEETAIIPPYSMQFVGTDVEAKPKGDILIQPSSQLSKLLVPIAVYPAKEVAFLLVRYPIDKEAVLKKNQYFGMEIEVQEVMSGNEDTDVQVVRGDTKYIVYECFFLYSDTKNTLKTMCNRSTQKLKRKDAALVAELLIKYQDVFCKGNLFIGQFNGTIKHHINTGDAKPSKQRLRRTPLHFKKEEEDHLNQMLQKNVIQESTSEWAATPVWLEKRR